MTDTTAVMPDKAISHRDSGSLLHVAISSCNDSAEDDSCSVPLGNWGHLGEWNGAGDEPAVEDSWKICRRDGLSYVE